MTKKATAISGAEMHPEATAALVVTATPPDKRKNPTHCSAGFYCYIGPSIAGLIQHGAVYRGTRADALHTASAAIEKQPIIRTLIVSGDELPEARLKVKRPGNALYANYRKIAAMR